MQIFGWTAIHWRRRTGSLRARRDAASLLALLAATPWVLAASEITTQAPRQLFAQAGVATDSRTLVIGATWPWDWERRWAGGRASGYWEVAIGRWASDAAGKKSSAWVTQLGLTPVLRWQPGSWHEGWFVEAGVGGNVLLPIYRSREKRFSTAFNFGDHVALGLRFGEGSRQEVALRLQHFSNAGIRRPNPGENFVQVRYSAAF
jgi:lipid A 3-O-deacylase